MLQQTGLNVLEEKVQHKRTRKHGIDINGIYDYVVFKNLIISMKNVTHHVRFLYGSLTIRHEHVLRICV